MVYQNDEIFEKLSLVRWNTALRTYGNPHCTLIGLLVNWWVELLPNVHWAVEGPGRKGKGYCDAIFASENSAIGILEVECSKYEHCLMKIKYFFDEGFPELQFAILLAYTDSQGRPPVDNEIIPIAKEISKAHSNKSIFIISIEKIFEDIKEGLRARNIYYQCRPNRIEALILRNGNIVSKRELIKI